MVDRSFRHLWWPRKPWWPEVDNDEVTIAAEEAPQEMVGVARGRDNVREGPRRAGMQTSP